MDKHKINDRALLKRLNEEIMKKRDTKESVLLKLDELSRSQHNGKRDSGTQQRPASLNGPIGMIPMFRRRSRWSLR
ncbi:STK36 [Symbiodinium necroappetens]|uniref:STK36 protein n=1 Tax=Symbiodinium necroappetens TaxID=1628268 RepID=A0A812QX58_9DINO|nr:STK36 [Symbiodinium necroappetens]